MVWQNVKGGGIAIDAFVLAKDPSYTPTDNPLPGGDFVIKVAEFAALDEELHKLRVAEVSGLANGV